MKKYIFAALAVMAAAFSASAKTDSYTMLLNTKAGNTVEFEFEYYPVAAFDGDEVVITDDIKSEALRYDMGEIDSLTFKSTPAGVESVSKADLRVKVTKEYLTVEGLEKNDIVKVYNVGGALVASGKADSDGKVYIDLSGLSAGVFVANMPGNNFKFIR